MIIIRIKTDSRMIVLFCIISDTHELSKALVFPNIRGFLYFFWRLESKVTEVVAGFHAIYISIQMGLKCESIHFLEVRKIGGPEKNTRRNAREPDRIESGLHWWDPPPKIRLVVGNLEVLKKLFLVLLSYKELLTHTADNCRNIVAGLILTFQ